MTKLINNKNNIQWLNWIRDVAIIFVIILGVSAWQSRNMLDSGEYLTEPKTMLPKLDGGTSYLIDSKKPTLIYFFAPWCGICELSIGNLDYIDSTQLNVVAVAMDYTTIEEVSDFVNQHTVSSKVLLGHEGLKQQFKIQGYPSYYLINENQTIVSKSFGYSTALGLKIREFFGRT